MSFFQALRQVLVGDLKRTERAIIKAIHRMRLAEEANRKTLYIRNREKLIRACVDLNDVWGGFELCSDFPGFEKGKKISILPEPMKDLISQVVQEALDPDVCDGCLDDVIEEMKMAVSL